MAGFTSYSQASANVKKLLSDTNMHLSSYETIECLLHCVEGELRAREAAGRDSIIFIGNTGAGKSTTKLPARLFDGAGHTRAAGVEGPAP